ncbi:hypothetical protein clg_66 [Corynebacterium phage CL31]|nr:hypothetical protein clg_66 [Corynebacterium phage CL31]
MKLVLTVGAWYQLDSGRFMKRVKGDLVEVSDQTGAWLLRVGSAKHPGGEAEAEESQEQETLSAGGVAPEPDSGDEPPEPAESPDGHTEVVDRPANAANRDAWDAYARKVGVDPTQYKSKEELRAALP